MLPKRLLSFSKTQTTWERLSATHVDGDLPASIETNGLLADTFAYIWGPREKSWDIIERDDQLTSRYHRRWRKLSTIIHA